MVQFSILKRYFLPTLLGLFLGSFCTLHSATEQAKKEMPMATSKKKKPPKKQNKSKETLKNSASLSQKEERYNKIVGIAMVGSILVIYFLYMVYTLELIPPQKKEEEPYVEANALTKQLMQPIDPILVPQIEGKNLLDELKTIDKKMKEVKAHIKVCLWMLDLYDQEGFLGLNQRVVGFMIKYPQTEEALSDPFQKINFALFCNSPREKKIGQLTQESLIKKREETIKRLQKRKNMLLEKINILFEGFLKTANPEKKCPQELVKLSSTYLYKEKNNANTL